MPSENRRIDWPAAATQLVAVLASVSRLANADPDITVRRPVSAALLARLVFGQQLAAGWTHETRRKHIRDAAALARRQLARDQAAAQICASCSPKDPGYWLESDAATIARYAALRRRQGLRSLAAASNIKTAIAPAAGQSSLLPPSPYRH